MDSPNPLGGLVVAIAKIVPPHAAPVVAITVLIAAGLVPAIWIPYAGTVLILLAVGALLGLRSG